MAYDPIMVTVTLSVEREGPLAGVQEVKLNPLEFLACFTQHFMKRGQHQVRYYGAISNKSRGMRRKAKEGVSFRPKDGPSRSAARRRWGELLRKVYPRALTCPRCGATMKLIAVITEGVVIQEILEHLGRWPNPFPQPVLDTS